MGAKAVGVVIMLAAMALGSPCLGADKAEVQDRTALRVCADPAAPPLSTEDGKGFENRIAELFAKELGVPVQYTWFPNGLGFYRRTLNVRRCDIVMGTVVGLDMAQTTIPYYRSTYVLVTRATDKVTASTLEDPALRTMTLGVQAQTPAADLLARSGMLDKVRSYNLMVDSRSDSIGRRLIDDLAAKTIDGAVVWGPIGAYFAGLTPGAFRVTPLSSSDKSTPLAFDIGMAVRFGEPKWRAQVEAFIRSNRARIKDILVSHDVPLMAMQGVQP